MWLIYFDDYYFGLMLNEKFSDIFLPVVVAVYMKNRIYSTIFKISEGELVTRRKEERKESQIHKHTNTQTKQGHVTLSIKL